MKLALQKSDMPQTLLQRLSNLRQEWQSLSSELGCIGGAKLQLIRALQKRLYPNYFPSFDSCIWIRNAVCPAGVYMRPGASDSQVFRQIFIEREYDPICEKLTDVRTILDLGANAGYSSVFFMERYPGAHVVAVEPDARNYALCLRNLERYGNRCRIHQAAIWKHSGTVSLRNTGALGQEWAVQAVEGTQYDGTNIDAISMADLLKAANWQDVDLLKIDIEGAESVLFSDKCDVWLPKVRNICIELHGAACRKIFFDALVSYAFDELQSGELIVALNLHRNFTRSPTVASH